jgi:hypothetical protein
LDAVHGRFGWIFQKHRASAHMSQRAVDWLEESVDIIVDLLANSQDLLPIELLWTIFKRLVKRINPQAIEDLKAKWVPAWAFIPQTSIDFSKGFNHDWSSL